MSRHEERTWSAYVAAPADAFRGLLPKILRDFDVTTSDYLTANPGPSILAAVTATIRECDFLLLVLRSSSDMRWSLVELGIALALNKRVLALADSDAAMPLDLPEVAVVKVDFDQAADLRFALSGFLALFDQIPIANERWSIQSAQGRVRVANVAHDFESRVVALFSAAGADTHASRPTDTGVDLVVWLPTAIPGLGNRLLVQLKHGALTRDAYRRARGKLQEQLRRSGLAAGLFVYSDSQGKVFRPAPGWPLVLTATIGELENAVEEGGLTQFLAQQRNQLAHSV